MTYLSISSYFKKKQEQVRGKWLILFFALSFWIVAPAGMVAQTDQKIHVTGKVVDTSGDPIIGGSIAQKGSPNGTVTDIDGNFRLEVPKGAVITIQYLGYITLEQVITTDKPLSFILKEDLKKLDEVVVIGYGTRQRKNILGAVDQIGKELIENRPVSNAMQALQGASANLIIQQKSMNPNDNNMNINIRGVSTFGDNSPLIVIDGLISATGTLNNLNPADIESVSVLKDAGSAAIYGSRSANGVILITTKKGVKNAKPVIRFNTMTGYEDPHVLFTPVKGYENALLRNQAAMNSGSMPLYSPEQIRDLQAHQGEESWWLNDILQKGLQQSYNVNISGGNETTTYLVSAGYFNQESNFVGNYGLERYNFRSNINTEYGRLKLTSMMAYNRNMQRTVAGGTGNVIIDSSRIPPYYYYKIKENGKYFLNDVNGELNPLAHLEKGGYENKDEDNILGNLDLSFNIIEGLQAKGLLGLDLTQHHRYRRFLEVPLYYETNLNEPARTLNSTRQTDDYNQKRYTLSTQFMLDFDRTFNKVHQVTALLGASNESYTLMESFIGWKYTDPDMGLPTTVDSEIDPGSKTPNDGTDKTRITSLFGRLGYDYMDRYYVESSFRYDGSSKFHKDHRWGFFPSVSAGWRLSSENFMETYSDKVGDLKVRGSYGVLGSQNVPNYSFFTTYQMYKDIYGFNNESVPGTGFNYGNEFLTWEKAANFNIGVDASFLKNKLFLSFDYFNKRTSNILMNMVVPSVFGTEAPKQNKGIMDNRGWEATISYRGNTGEFHHNVSLNIADSKNRVFDFGGEEKILDAEQMSKLIREGVAFGSYYGWKTDGVFQSYEDIANSALPIGVTVHPGDVKYVNTNGDDVIDDKDRVILGNAFPRYTYGLTYNLSWKGFDMGFLIQGVGKRDMVLRGELLEPFHANYSKVIYQHQLDFWTPANQGAKYPRLTEPGSASNANNYGKSSDLLLLDAAYLRLKNLQIGYTLPKATTAKLGIQKLRISLNAQNLLTLTKNSFIDPESSEFDSNMGGTGGTSSSSGRNYPTLIYYGFGLDLEF
jgi:TonB-linked SusC/RagA family outer membrane protein